VARPDQKTAELGRSRATGSAATPHPGPPPQGGREAERTIPDSVISLLDRASSLADSGQYLEARALVEQILSTDNSSARAYFLLGMIEQAAGLRQRAEEHYLKAIYLDPQHDEALLALALLARRKGDVAAESSYRRRAERVRSRKVVP
jgi:chemotaxis protein methyltransferase WspC